MDRLLGSLAILLGMEFDASENMILCAVQEVALATQSLRPFVDPSCVAPTQVAQAVVSELMHWRSAQLPPPPPPQPLTHSSDDASTTTRHACWSFDAGETSRDMFAQRECAMQVLREFSCAATTSSSSTTSSSCTSASPCTSASVAVHGAWAFLHWVPEGRIFVPMEIDVLAKEPEKVARTMVDALTEKFGAERRFSIAQGTSGTLRLQGNLHHIADISPWEDVCVEEVSKEDEKGGGEPGEGGEGGQDGGVAIRGEKDIVIADGWGPLKGVCVITLEAWRRRTEAMVAKPSCSFRRERDEARLAMLSLRTLREDVLTLEAELASARSLADKLRSELVLKVEERDERIHELLCHSESLQCDLLALRSPPPPSASVAVSEERGGEDDDGSEDCTTAEEVAAPEDAKKSKKNKKKKKKKTKTASTSASEGGHHAATEARKKKSGGGGGGGGGCGSGDSCAQEMEMLDAFIETAEWGRLASELEEKLEAAQREQRACQDSCEKMSGEVQNQKDCAIFFDRALSLSLSLLFEMSKVCSTVFESNEVIVFKILDTLRASIVPANEADLAAIEDERERDAISGVAQALEMLKSHLLITQSVLQNMGRWCQLSVGDFFPLMNRPKDYEKVGYLRGQEVMDTLHPKYQSVFARLNHQRVVIANLVTTLVAGIKAPCVFVVDRDGNELKLPIAGDTTAFLDKSGMIAEERRVAARDIANGEYGKNGSTVLHYLSPSRVV